MILCNFTLLFIVAVSVFKFKDDQYFIKHDKATFKIPDQVFNTFNDGIRSIDFVITYDEKIGKAEKHGDLEKALSKRRARETFLENLRQIGLEIEEDLFSTDKTKIHFIKLHIPWNVLTKYAEELSFRVPIKVLYSLILLLHFLNLSQFSNQTTSKSTYK